MLDAVRLTLAQDLANEGPERLSKRCMRNIPLVLVELPGDEDPARQDDRFVQLMHERGLADPGIAADENQDRCTGDDHLTEGIEQSFALSIPAVEFLGHQKSI